MDLSPFPLTLAATGDENDAALADLSAYSVPLDDITSGALYELWQSA